MTDLQINVALAKAMGWERLDKWSDDFRVYDTHSYGGIWRKFSYLDPVIFVAICKHWGLVVNFRDGFASGIDGINVVGEWEKPCFIEKAVALVVIELAKRGIQ